ncbi:hypothetical protein BKA62DRAFT_695701 [Auriculariales sp. MPI-PUGE-AT-0066]|nr:hypothetical protein BKA62DRAFT_695701 [Auriculariales sp. MPI-PUGE-AT-0066]
MTSSSTPAGTAAPGPIRLDSKSPPPPPYEQHVPAGRVQQRDDNDDVDDRLPSDEEYDDDEDDELLMRQRHAPEIEQRERARFVQSQSQLDEFRTRFDMNRPSVWKRIILIAFVLVLTYFAFTLRYGRDEQVVHARRYSARHRYRPAASPVLTTVLPDGRVKVRGDEVGAALQAERLRKGRPTDAVEVKGSRKGRARKNKKEAKAPRQVSREA